MADEKKNVANEVASDAAKSEKKAKEKKPSKFSPKKVGKAIAKFFKDLRGETKKIVWPGRKMVIKSTGVVLAAILVVGAGIWILDFALSGAITALGKAAENTTEVTETVTDDASEENAEEEEHDHDHDHEEDESTEK